MKKSKIISFFILFVFLFVPWTIIDYFFGFGFGYSFTWKEFFERLPWTILGCTVCSIYCIKELDLNIGEKIVKWYKKNLKKNNTPRNLDQQLK